MQKLNKIRLLKVHYIPKTLEAGVLYLSEEFGAAVHLCACGCGAKVSTPVGPTDWAIQDTARGPSVKPSVGNWQLPCKSHYWISEGRVLWADEWTPEQIAEGREAEELRHRAYFKKRAPKRGNVLQRFWNWIIRSFDKDV